METRTKFAATLGLSLILITGFTAISFAQSSDSYDASITVEQAEPVLEDVRVKKNSTGATIDSSGNSLVLDAGANTTVKTEIEVSHPNGISEIDEVDISVDSGSDFQNPIYSESLSGTCQQSSLEIEGNAEESTTANYSCTYNHSYYDDATEWEVNATIVDNTFGDGSGTKSSVYAYDVAALDAISVQGNPSFGSITPGESIEVTSDANNPTVVNEGNQQYNQFEITAYNLTGESGGNSDMIPAKNFTVAGNSAFDDSGSQAAKQLSHGSATALDFDGSLSAGASEEQTVYHKVGIPEGIQEDTYSATSNWQISVN